MTMGRGHRGGTERRRGLIKRQGLTPSQQAYLDWKRKRDARLLNRMAREARAKMQREHLRAHAAQSKPESYSLPKPRSMRPPQQPPIRPFHR